MVAFYMDTARSGELHKYYFFLIFWIFLKKSVNRKHPFDDTLGIINPVYSDADNLIL